MSFIEPTRTGPFFRPTDIVFGRVMEELESFDASGLIDRGTFYTYVKEVLHNLGAAIYREDDGILDVVNNNTRLPDNFCIFWVAYSVKPPADYLRAKGYDPRQDISLFTKLGCNPYTTDSTSSCCNKNWSYQIECPSQLDMTSKIAVRYYIKGSDTQQFNFTYPQLLRFGATPNQAYVDMNSPCYRSGAPLTMNIDNDKYLWTSFPSGSVYIQYWGMPVDKETGLPFIPDNANIEKAIEFYLEYRLLRKWYMNNQIADLERKVAMLKSDSEDAFATALNETKTSSFQSLIQMARNQKRKLSVFQLNHYPNFR